MLYQPTNAQVYKILKARINTYFEQSGKSRHADPVLWIKMSLFVLLAVVSYSLLLAYGSTSLPVAFACYMLFMLGSGFFVVTVGHDASHQALLKRKSANTILSYAWNFIGISKQLWEIKHHHSHHVYTNIPHQDVDIAESPLLRFSPSYPYRSYYKYQHLYAPLLYSLFGMHIVYVRDFTMYFSIRNTMLSANRLPRYFFAQLLVTKLCYLLITFIIPLLVLPFAWWHVLLLYIITQGIAGALLLLVLVVPHINEDAEVADSLGIIKGQNDWALHQIHSTVDSSVNSRVLSWLTGGLNTHLVHHLFPNICHVHYLPLTKIVKQELCNQGIKYNEKTFGASIRDHFRYLKLMGRAPAKIQNEGALL